MTQYYFKVSGAIQNQIFVGTKEQLEWLGGVLLNQGILETQPEIFQADERVNGLLEQYRGENGDGGIRRKKLPHYSAYNEDSQYGEYLTRKDENSITLLYVSLKDEVNWGQLIVRDVGGGARKFDDSVKNLFGISQQTIVQFGGIAGSEDESIILGTKLNFANTNASTMLALTLKEQITSFGSLYNQTPQENGSNPMVHKFADKKGIGEKKWKLGEDFIVIFGNPYVFYGDKGAALKVYVVAINAQMRADGIPQGEITIDNERFYVINSLTQDWKPVYEEYMNRAGEKLAKARGGIEPSGNITREARTR
jgi:hypothetical protein